ncbi:uncharacterized protein MELLADRAFT_105136 [Melampsora larici-populina 98AG31]|uniref:Uncharacterized protein n=1 Tax=Melampsora larici-populina (strain 98AG31 / pathotype 3-4-7) TaxID=747676 RepID=F4RHJ5_MELLP|nr:uncharacterized protein MELLADRAFT_105136 [Melampsora larici-populina 98AG31]EGG08348.1 hypothetical protein MELLADRAFT_105136 [Melampsora larici-populina 98AG31]
MIPSKDDIADQLSDLASFSPDEADSMIQSAAGRSPLPSPPPHCASFSSLHQLSHKPEARPSTPDHELIDQTEWDHLSFSTQSSPEKNSSHPSSSPNDYDLNHSPHLLSSSNQPNCFYPSCSPTPSYINLDSNKSSVSNLKTSNHHLKEWRKSLPAPEVVPPEATISELLGVSTRIERRLSIEDDRQSLQNDLDESSELRPRDNSQEISRSSKELEKEETRDTQTEPIPEGMSSSDTKSDLHNRLTYSHLALLGSISCSATAIIYARMMSNEGQVSDEVQQPNLEGPITDTDSPDVDIPDNAASANVLPDVKDSDQPAQIAETEKELVGPESMIDTLQDPPLISVVQDTVQESSSVSIDSEIDSLKIEDSIIIPTQEIEMKEILQSEILNSNREKQIDPPSSSSLVSYFTSSYGIWSFLMILLLFWKIKTSSSSKYKDSQKPKNQNILVKKEINEIEHKPIILSDLQKDQIKFSLKKIFDILDGKYIPQDKETVVMILKSIISYSWIVRPFYTELINRLMFKSNRNSNRSKVDRVIMMKLIRLLKQKKLIQEDLDGKMNDEEDEEEGDMKWNYEQLLLLEAIQEIETETETKPEIKGKGKGSTSKPRRKSKSSEIKIKAEEEEDQIEPEIVSETETILPTSQAKTKKLKSNKKSSKKNQEEINQDQIDSGRRRSSVRIKSEPIEEPKPDFTQNVMINKKTSRKSQAGINHTTPTAVASVPVRSSPRNKKL